MKIHYSWIIFFIFEDVIGEQERFADIGSLHLIDKNISNAIHSKELLNARSHQRHSGRRKDEKNKSNDKRTYSAWSHWTGCGQTYKTESRKRTCLKKAVCYDAVQTETRSCQNKRLSRVRGGRGGAGRALPQYRFGRENVSENDNDYVGFQVITEKQNSQDDMSKRRDNDFTKWTRWTKCSERCITYRRRYCKRHSRCGRKMVREAAYCYVEGSFCQHWIATKLKRRLKNDVDNTVSPKAEDEPKCGLQYGGRSVQNRYKYWNMVKIIGGRPSPKGKWPWQIVILDKYKEAFCGGTLVHLRWVLTAAHCVRKRLFVRVGEHNLRLREPNELEMRITEAIIHPLYDPNIVDNDIAMLRLPHPARPDLGHTTACLPTFRQHLPSGRLCTILGWGKLKSSDHYGTNILHEVQIPIVPMTSCKRTYHDYYITPNMFCAGFRKGKMDSCAGDSGGPLLCKDPNVAGEPWTVFGITSFGDGCGKKGKFGIYTRTPNYIRWVHRVLKMSYYQDN